MVPPYIGWGWQTRAAWLASAKPELSRASIRPLGPSRNSERIEPVKGTVSIANRLLDSVERYVLRARMGRWSFPQNWCRWKLLPSCSISGRSEDLDVQVAHEFSDTTSVLE